MIRNGVGPLGMLTEPYDRSGPPLSEEPDRNYYSTGPAVKPVCTGEPTGAVCTPQSTLTPRSHTHMRWDIGTPYSPTEGFYRSTIRIPV